MVTDSIAGRKPLIPYSLTAKQYSVKVYFLVRIQVGEPEYWVHLLLK
jgi:hypothetical protein